MDDDVHHSECERRVGARIDGQIPVGAPRGAGPVGIDYYQFGALATGFFDEWPQMDVIAMNIRGPGDDVA